MTKSSRRVAGHSEQPVRVQVNIGGVPRRMICFVEGDHDGRPTNTHRRHMALPVSVGGQGRDGASGND